MSCIKRFYNIVRVSLLHSENTQKVQNTNGLILDVGSGATPFQYADILCDLYPNDSFQRRGHKLKTVNRPFVICDAQFLPFKSNAFGLVFCSHLLEHIPNPKLAFDELKRVGKVVQIETPSWFREDIFCSNPYHRWVFMVKHGKLFVRKPINGLNLKLDAFPGFNAFEYLVNKLCPLFLLSWRFSCND
jgi:SAM-dependent methyltransferase